MPTLNIEGQKVTVDEGFLKLSPDQQNATVEEIAKSLPKTQAAKPSITDAVTDVPSEIGKAASENIDTIKKGVTNRGTKGPIEGLMDTGKAIMALPGLLASPLTGAARSLIGHPMAQAEHAVGTLIAPEIAAKDDPAKMYEAAKGDVDTAMSALAAREVPVAPAVAPKPVAPTIAELKAAAKAGYQSPEVEGLAVKPDTISRFSQGAQAVLNDAGFDENVAPKTFGVLAKLEKVPDSEGGASTIVTGKNINSIRKIFGKAAGSTDPTERAAAQAVIDHLDDFVPKIPKADVLAGDPEAAAKVLEDARGNYSAAKQAEKIDNKTVQAEVRAAASNSGMNVANTVRQRMADVVLKPAERRGLLPEEVQAAQAISEGTPGQNVLRKASNVLGGGGGLGMLHASSVGAGAGAFIAGPVGAAIGAALPAIAGHTLKAISNTMTLKQAAKLSEMIRSRAPLASSMQKFEEGAGAFGTVQNAKTAAGVMIAARNLSNNLRGAGFNVSPADLLRDLQSPSTSSAQQQNDVPRPPGQ